MFIKAGEERITLLRWESGEKQVTLWFKEPLEKEQLDALNGLEISVLADESHEICRLPGAGDIEAVGYTYQVKTEAEKVLEEKNAAVLQAVGSVLSDEQARTLKQVWPRWRAGVDYMAGELFAHDDTLYRVEQAHTSKAHQPPDGAGMLAIYRPIQAAAKEGEVLPWVKGEAGLKVGDKRSFNGKVYAARQNPGANIWEPPTVPAIWEVSGNA